MRYFFVILTLAWSLPAMAADFVVNSSADSGTGTLREAISSANLDEEFDIITFELLESDNVILLESPLPTIVQSLAIYASGSFKGLATSIVLSGENAGDSDGLVVEAYGVVIEGMTIINFQRSGIVARGQIAGLEVIGCRIGTDGVECLGNYHHGILLEDGVAESTIGGFIGNIISGNGYDGIRIVGEFTGSTFIGGNYIGTDESGTLSIGNGWRSDGLRSVWTTPKTPPGVVTEGQVEGEQKGVEGEVSDEGVRFIDSHLRGGGILLANGAGNNFIGGSDSIYRNVISGNYWYGIKVVGDGSDGNNIQGNYIGVDSSGTTVLANEEEGIHVRSGPEFTSIGANGIPDSGNVIGGNNVGIKLDGPAVADTWIFGNDIGVFNDGEGGIPVPNRYVGIIIEDGPTMTSIGDGTPDNGNYISRNDVMGIQIEGVGTGGHLIRYNRITGNIGDGIFLRDGANGGIQAPVILGANTSSISGTAIPGLVIDVYSDSEDEGANLLGETTSDGDTGAWELTGDFSQAVTLNVTAIQTDPDSHSSSDFSSPVPITEAEGAVDGEGEPSIDVDFMGDIENLRNTPLANYLPEPYYSYLMGLDPTGGDFNGGVDITVTALPSNKDKGSLVDSVEFFGNGIPDSQELAVIEYLIENPSKKTAKLSGQDVLNGYVQNRNQIKNEQLGPNLGKPVDFMLPSALNIVAVYTLMGDGEITEQDDNHLVTTGGFASIKGYFQFFAAGVEKLGSTPIAIPEVQDEDYDLIPELGPDGDLDGDGATNLEEWQKYGPDGYLAAVLDPEVTPEGEGAADGEGSVEGTTEGTSEGTTEGTPEGTTEGTAEGTTEGTTEGTSDGEGTVEGSTEGSSEGNVEGSTEGTADGEGTSEGTTCDDSAYTADTGANGTVNLSEVLRLVQFYNVGEFSCAAGKGTEDGYQPGPGPQGCCTHKSDYLGGDADWKIVLSELLRVIQFYNSSGWTYCPGSSEDDFCTVFN